MRVLFSPVGSTDPISNFRDGALLHICRIYKPDVVYLYMSKEMVEFHKKDNRYEYCLEKLQELIDWKTDIKVIEKEDVINVQRFDLFYAEFREYIYEIKEKYKESEIYLNVSSGTPAMKSALQVIATLSEVKMMPIQVSTPCKKLNRNHEDKDNYDLYELWELNEDNNQDFENRAILSETPNLMAEIKKEMIVKLINSYDYVGAYDIAVTMKDYISDNATKLLKAAICRSQLNLSGLDKELNGTDFDLLPVKDSELRECVEYYLWLDNELKKENYSSFIRGITPIITNVLKQFIEINLKIKLADFTEVKNNIVKWNPNKIKKNKDMEAAFLSEYSTIKDNFVTYHQLVVIIRYYLIKLSNEYKVADKEKVLEAVDIVFSAERNARNNVAHLITTVTSEWIRDIAGNSPKEIIEAIKYLANKSKINIKNEFLNSYDNMNKLIIKELKKY